MDRIRSDRAAFSAAAPSPHCARTRRLIRSDTTRKPSSWCGKNKPVATLSSSQQNDPAARKTPDSGRSSNQRRGQGGADRCYPTQQPHPQPWANLFTRFHQPQTELPLLSQSRAAGDCCGSCRNLGAVLARAEDGVEPSVVVKRLNSRRRARAGQEVSGLAQLAAGRQRGDESEVKIEACSTAAIAITSSSMIASCSCDSQRILRCEDESRQVRLSRGRRGVLVESAAAGRRPAPLQCCG